MIRLVNMPFGSLTHPNLPLGLFSAQLAEAGIDHDVHYFNFDFAQAIGYTGYESIAFFKGVQTQVGEWLFADAAWRRPFGPSEDEFLARTGEELHAIPGIDDPVDWLRRIRHEVVPLYLDRCVDLLAADGVPEVVGFSCTFFQTVSSLALGRRLRDRHPEVRLVYGGACFHGEMGDELMRAAPWIDAASTGEADEVIVPLVDALVGGREPVGLPAVLYRDPDGAVRDGLPHRPTSTEAVAALPDPVFDPFFRDAARVGLDRVTGWQERLLAPFESSRGCWWGQKHHCRFCGLNGQGMAYRGRAGDEVEALLRRLTARYPQFRRYQASDNIMAVGYHETLVPRLAEAPLPSGTELFYSVKSNMTRDQVRSLAGAGIRYVQPGIESLSTNILHQMDKGVSALQNLFFLKCCRDHGILAYWNNLIRVPGETEDDYRQMARWIPLLHHLRPPYGGTPAVECHRFSPYFDADGRWVSDRRPQAWYRGLFPDDTVDLERVAYYFDADWRDVLEPAHHQAVVEATDEWIRVWTEEVALPRLQVSTVDPGGATGIVDTRRDPTGRWELDPVEGAVLRAIDYPVGPPTVARFAGAELGVAPSAAAVDRILGELVDAELALTEGDRYLSIVLGPEAVDPPLEERRAFLKHRV